MRRTLSILVVAAVASVGSAAITDISLGPPISTAEGMLNQISISFDGQYTGSQLIVTLDQGSIYQHSLGGTGAPSHSHVSVIPSLAHDSFVTQGGTTTDSSDGAVAIGGGAVGLGGDATPQWNAEGLNQAWNPAVDTVILNRTDFLVAHVTLSPDAAGTWGYLGAVGGAVSWVSEGIVAGAPRGYLGRGQIRGGEMFVVPEPATFCIGVWALLGGANESYGAMVL